MVIPLQQNPNKLVGWLWRYVPSEILGTAVALTVAWWALALGGGAAAAAVAATWAECLAYYSLMLARELRRHPPRSPRAALATLRNLLIEFGPAELLDGLLVRPTALYAGMALLPGLAAGVLAGKLVADLIFYVPAVISYELLGRRRAR